MKSSTNNDAKKSKPQGYALPGDSDEQDGDEDMMDD
jgi:hypothetical protein